MPDFYKTLMLSVLSLLFTQFSIAQLYQAEQLPSMSEAVSNNAVCGAEHNGKRYLYSFGGIDTSKVYSGIHLRSFKYDMTTKQWKKLPNLPDSMGKIAAGANAVKGYIYIIGGYHVFSGGNEKSSEKIHRFDIASDTFLSDGADIPVPTDDHVQAVWNDSLIYVISGWSQNTNIPNVQIYNPSTDSWQVGTPVPNNHSYKSFGASGTIVGNTIYYFGGAKIGGNFPIQNQLRVGKIDPNNPTQITWSISVPDANLVGYRMGCFQHNGKVFWVGGSNQTYNYNGIAYAGNVPVEPNNRILRLDTATLQFTTITNNISAIPMDIRGIYNHNFDIYIAGGMQSNQTVTHNAYWLRSKPDNVFQIKAAELSIYPNPLTSGNELTIELKSNQKIKQIHLIGIDGKSTLLEVNQNTINIPHRIANGLYTLLLEDNEHNISSQKLMIVR